MAHEMIGTQIVTERLVALLESGTEKVLLIDSRPFVEYNTSHILEAININCSKLMKRRLQQDKVLITELIQHSAKHKVDIDCNQKVVVYDQSSQDVASLSSDCFLTVLLGKLEKSFNSVHLLAELIIALHKESIIELSFSGYGLAVCVTIINCII
ncbi:dual specificity protein phosphatase 16-like isoform 1 [Cricetulus griseus]|nr:dual specificity protein phosphatase 16-like isoform 1 [Cricetulus griseus]